MRSYLKIFFFLLFSLAPIFKLFSQQGVAKAYLNNDTIVIGDVLQLSIEFDGAQPNEIFFPTITESISNNILVVKSEEPIKNKKDQHPLYYQNIKITSFDTGNVVIPIQTIKAVFGHDTIAFYTDSINFTVLPYMNMDTVKRDTIKAKSSGIIIFGRNAFKEEVAKAVPDSIRQGLNEDQIKSLEDSVRNLMFQQFVSELYRNIGFRNDEAAAIIANGAKQTIFILSDNEIKESIRIPGANDTVYVKENDEVKEGQNLFVTIKIKDIVDELYNTPFTWAQFWWRFWNFIKQNWWWLLLSLVFILVTLYYLFFRKKGIKHIFRRVHPPEPPHIIALRELERIRDEKKWQTGKLIEFYSELTETLRRYFEGRFGIYAMEMTSEEIMQAINNRSEFEQKHIDMIRQILDLADSVKFANAEPLLNDNDACLKNAFIIVEDTIEQSKPEDINIVDAFIEVEPNNSEEENQNA